MAFDVRLPDAARQTRDIDLGLRGTLDGPADLHDRLVDDLAADPDDDGWLSRLVIIAGGTARVAVARDLGGDIS